MGTSPPTACNFACLPRLPWDNHGAQVADCLPACQILDRYDVSSALALRKGFLGSPTPYFLLVYCDILLFPGDSRLDQRDLDTIYENKVPRDHPMAYQPAGEKSMEAESLRAHSHAPESLHGDSTRVIGKQLIDNQDASVFPSAPSFFSSSGCEWKLMRKASSFPRLSHKSQYGELGRRSNSR